MLSIGNIVRVICQKYVEYLSFGQIIEIKDNDMVIVKIPKIFPSQERVIQCHINDIELHADYPDNIKASQLFGKLGWIYYSAIKTPLNPDITECQYQDCDQKAARRAMVNILGTVCEADLCEKHADKYHGTLQEIFPWKKKEPV